MAEKTEVISRLVQRISTFLHGSGASGSGSGLLDLGMVDTPSAGYLPADPTRSVQRQVRDLFGPGVDLRFCAVRPDFVPEAFWQAQHMERISLTRGLRDPDRREEVDVLVPDGSVREGDGAWSQVLRGTLRFGVGDTDSTDAVRDRRRGRAGRDGVAMREQPVGASAQFQLGAVLRTVWGPRPELTVVAARDRDEDQELEALLWAAITLDADPFTMATGSSAGWSGHGHVQTGEEEIDASDIAGGGTMTVVGRPSPDVVETRLTGKAREVSFGDEPEVDDIPPLRARWTRVGPTVIGVRILFTDRDDVERVLVDAQLGRDHVGAQVPPARVVATFDEVVSSLTDDADWPPVQRALDRVQRARAELKLPDEGFRIDAEDRLVGPRPSGGASELVATRDWVLFHRRRAKVCGDVVPPEAPARLRRYLVLRHELDPAILAESVGARLTTGAGFEIDLAQYALDDERGTVAFEEGRTDLREAGLLLARWNEDGLGAHALVAMELATSRPEAETVQRARLLAVEAALPHVRGVTPDVRVGREALPEAWQERLSATSVDGLVLLATTTKQRIVDDPPETRHTVLVLVVDADLLQRQRDALENLPGGTTLDELEEMLDTTDAFDARFENDEWVNPGDASDGVGDAVNGVWLTTTVDPPEGIDVATSVDTVLEVLGVSEPVDRVGTGGVADPEHVAVVLLGTR